MDAAAVLSIPMTPMQSAMVLALDSAPRSGAYVIQDICEFPYTVERAHLEHAWRQVITRHSALRRRVHAHDLMDVPDPAFEWQEFDRHPPNLDEFLFEDRTRGFDFRAGVPMRFTLFHGPGSATLVWTIHHVLLDAPSLALVWNEWLALYDGLTLDPPPASTPPQFDLSAAESYWRAYLADSPEPVPDLVDRTASSTPTGQTARLSTTLATAQTHALADLAARTGVTLSTLVQAAWALLISRYKGCPDIIVGVTRAAADPAIVGMRINTLPLRTRIDEAAPLSPWLQALRRDWQEQRKHQPTPLPDLHKSSRRTPLFDSIVVFQPSPFTEVRGRRVRRIQRAANPLLLVACGGPTLLLELVYDTGRFNAWMISAVLDHLRTLLESFPTASHLRDVRMLPLAPIEGGAVEYPSLPVHRLFEHQSASAPSNMAFEAGMRSVTYDEANRLANRWARTLQHSHGIAANEIVGICLPRSPEAVIAILAVMKAGGAFLPLDPSLPPERITAMVETAALILVTSEADHLPTARTLLLDSLRRESEHQPDDNLTETAAPADLAYVLNTSGSTGKPKAVAVPHRALTNHTRAACAAMGITAADRRLQTAHTSSDVFVAEIFNYLSSGATLVFALNPQGFSMAEYLDALQHHSITITGISASWWTEWVAALEAGIATVPTSLRAIVAGMESVDPGVFARWRRLAGTRIRWFNGYGPTETCITATVYEGGASTWESAGIIPIGKPHPNTTAYVLDASLNPCAAGQPGELFISGAGVALGYPNDPVLTAERFLPDLRGHGTMYRTGDRVFQLPDGNLVFLGRTDRQVKVRGFRVELEDVEGAIARCPGVRQCAVIQAESGGLLAYVTPVEGSTVSSDVLRAQLASSLPAYMLPSSWKIVEEISRTPSGKLDRTQLDTRSLRSPLEDRLADLWTRVLDVSGLSPSSDFFELGGDSLRAVQLILLIRQELACEVPYAALLRAPTIAGLAAWLEGRVKDASPVVIYRAGGALTPVFLISSLIEDSGCFAAIAEGLSADHPIYGLPNPVDNPQPVLSVEELAARVLRQLRDLRPEGPYILGGYCFGGVVAWDVARQLITAGDTVERMVLFDTVTPGYPKLAGGGTRYLSYLRQFATGRTRGVTPADILRHIGFLGNLAARKVSEQAQRTTGPTAEADVIHPARLYRPQPLPIPVIHFLADNRNQTTRIIDDPRLGWRDFARAFEAHVLTASHTTLFLDESAAAIAAILNRRIDLR